MRGSRRAISRAHARPVTVIREETHPLQSDSRSGPQFVCTGDGAQPHAGARDSSEARCDPFCFWKLASRFQLDAMVTWHARLVKWPGHQATSAEDRAPIPAFSVRQLL